MSAPKKSSEPSPQAAASGGQAVKALVAVVALAAAGFYIWQQLQPKPAYEFNPATFAFNDQAETNCPLDGCDVESLEFAGIDGRPLDLKPFLGQKNVVLVVTRGNTSGSGQGPYHRNICLYCATQTSRLIANYPAFQDQDAEVVVVFPLRQADGASPGESGPIVRFREALNQTGATAPPPFPLVLDVGLRAVERLGIRDDLSKPATYIVDKQGQVRFAHVGATIADRPSVRSMLDQLVAINADAK